MEAAGPAKWTTENTNMLLETMKQSIANRERDRVWNVGLRALDWEIVAFKTFTPDECRAKWVEIMQKLRKIKTLTELIVDAQNAMEDQDSDADFQIERPKRPSTANGIYFSENKDNLKKMLPGLKSRDLMRLANQNFRKLPPKDKEKYLQQAKEQQEQYQLTMNKLRSTLKKKKKKKPKDGKENASVKKKSSPRLKNGYQLFCKEQKFHMAGVPREKITTVWSERWNMLTQKQKDEYGRRCTEMKGNKKGFPGEPKMPTRSICGLHCKKRSAEMKGQRKTQPQKELIAQFSRESKSLSKHEREKYQAEIKKNLCKYNTQLQKWFKTLTPEKQQEYCKIKPSKLKHLKCEQPTSHHRTSDSEDEDLDDSDSDSDVTVFEEVHDIEDEEEAKLFHEMFDLF